MSGLIPILVTLRFVVLLGFSHSATNVADAKVDHQSSLKLKQMSEEIIEWPFNTTTTAIFTSENGLYDHQEEEQGDNDRDDGGVDNQRRSLYYYYRSSSPRRYYVSYAALSANRIPCPPRSGRSYCLKTGIPVNPYSRGCSTITRCRR